MPTRDLSNKRIRVSVGLRSQVADLSCPLDTEIASLLHLSAAVRWNGLDFGMQASDKVDDRSLEDDASAQLRGFTQYGGGVPIFFPKRTDSGSVLRQAFTLLSQSATDLVWVERIGWGDVTDPIVAGDNVNVYAVTTDGFKPDTEGDGGYAYLLTMLARGESYPWTIVRDATPAPVTVTAVNGGSAAVGTAALLRATYRGNDVTKRAQWRSSDATKITVEGGVAVRRAAGAASIFASFPGATESAAQALTAA
jgi:hypothetical protein